MILQSTKLSFTVNGKSVGYFSCKRGVRHGDPLSPLLFCLAEDVLSRRICYLTATNALVPMAGPRGCRTPTHVFYADDIMVFCKGTRKNLGMLMSFFVEYGQMSSQYLSLDKCKYYASSMSSRRRLEVSNTLGFKARTLLFTYLGVPIFTGKLRVTFLLPLADKIWLKLSS